LTALAFIYVLKHFPAGIALTSKNIRFGEAAARHTTEAGWKKRADLVWGALCEVVHPHGYDYPVFRRTREWLEIERNRKISS
jgi:hypothetical protein